MRTTILQKKSSIRRGMSLLLSILLACTSLPPSALDIQAADTQGQQEMPDLLQMQTLTSEGDEHTVTVDGMLPDGAQISATTLATPADGCLCAVDITITDKQGGEFQPAADAPLTVTLRNPAIGSAAAQEQLRLWHIGDDGIREEITDFSVSGDTLIFSANGFSVYEVDNGEPPLRTYLFEMPDDPDQPQSYTSYYFPTSSPDGNGGYKMVCQQTIKNGEKLVFPQLPSDLCSRCTFSGWYALQDGSLSETAYDFENVPPVTQTEKVVLRAVFKAYVYAIFHEQYNSSSQRFPVLATRCGDFQNISVTDVYGNQTDYAAEVSVADLLVTYDDPEHTPPRQMAFKGWTVVPDTCETQEEILAYTESPAAQIIETDTIFISETTRLYPVFEPIGWLEFNTSQESPENDAAHYTGATYKPPLYFPLDDGFDFSEETAPTLAGYAFDGWFTAEGERVTNSTLSIVPGLYTSLLVERNGRLFFREQSPPTAQVELYAHWTPADSRYTVVIWKQQAGDTPDLTGDYRSWDFDSSFIISARTGSTAAVTPEQKQLAFTGFTCDSFDEPTVVRGDGKTILNVYYRRNKHTFTFRRNNRIIHMVDALYGTDISGIWHFTGNDGNTYPLSNGSVTSWKPSGSSVFAARITQMLLMPDEDITFDYMTTNNQNRYFHYYVEALPGTPDTRTYGRMEYVPYNANLETVVHDFNLIFYEDDFLELEGFTRYQIATADGVNVTNLIGSNTDWNDNWNNELYFYYTRNSYTAEMIDSHDNHVIHSESILFEAPVAGHIPPPPTPPTGYEFTGWYADEACSTPVAFTQEEADLYRSQGRKFQDYVRMPAHGFRVYVGWQTQWFKIELDPNGGELTGTQATWFWEPYNGDPIEEYKNVTRNYEPDRGGSYYYALRNRAYYGLGEEWDTREETEFANRIIDGHCTRGAFYSTDNALATDVMRYRRSEGAYRYIGWFEVDPVTGRETPFNFGTRVLKNTYLKLRWKQLDTYFIEYRAGAGTIDRSDFNEQTFEFLNANGYADHADVVVTRTATAPPGMNFAGWKIRKDESGTIYYPGQSFQFDSMLAEQILIPGVGDELITKRIITLDAVYEELHTATIIYDPNGGNVDRRALEYGGGQDTDRSVIYTQGTEHPLTVSYALENGRLIVSDLMNNSAVRLAEGTGFTNPGYVFAGWSTSPDGQNGTFYKADSLLCYADTGEPMTLYAQWELRVYFDKNLANAPDNPVGWGGDWSSAGYLRSQTDGLYYTVIRLGSRLTQPAFVPQSTVPDEMFRWWSLDRQTQVGSLVTPFDFGITITQEIADANSTLFTDSTGRTIRRMTLYGCWDTLLEIPVHIVDTTDPVWVRHDEWRRDGVTSIRLGNTPVTLADAADAAVFADPERTAGRQFAFACIAGNGEEDHLNVSEERAVTAIRYDPFDRQVKVQSAADGSWRALDTGDTSPDAVWLVYFAQKRSIPISYMQYAADRTLTEVTSLHQDAPRTADVTADGYAMHLQITQPLQWAEHPGYTPLCYSFALGERNAQTADGLLTVTGSSQQDTARPVLNIRSTWKGLEYTLDGGQWYPCGSDKQLYVLYYEVYPNIVHLTERTIGLPENMEDLFDYQIRITDRTTVTKRTRYYYWSNSANSYIEITNDANFAPTEETTIDETQLEPPQICSLSDGQTRSLILLCGTPREAVTQEYTDTGRTIRIQGRNRSVYSRTTTTTQFDQRAVIVQQHADGYITSNDAAQGDRLYESRYTAQNDAQPVTITYTNTHQFERHIHLAIARNGTLLHDDTLRTTDTAVYSHIFGDIAHQYGDTWKLSEVNPETFITDHEHYVYVGTIAGQADESGVITPSASTAQVDSLSLGDLGNGTYGYYLNGDTTLPSGSQDIFLVYLERPKIKYMFRVPESGELIEIDPLEKNGEPYRRDDVAAVQGERLPVTADQPLLVSQISTAGDPAFLLPDLLDHDGKHSVLDLSEIGVKRKDETFETLPQRSVRIYYADYGLHLGSADSTLVPGDDLTVYAVYRVRGYALTLVKNVLGDINAYGDPPEAYTFTVTSDVLEDGEYYVSGDGFADTECVLAANNTITVTLPVSGSATIYGLPQGDYSITELTPGSFTMEAEVNGRSAVVSGKLVAVHMDEDKTVTITNLYPIPVTDASSDAAPWQAAVLLAAAFGGLVILRRKRRDDG